MFCIVRIVQAAGESSRRVAETAAQSSSSSLRGPLLSLLLNQEKPNHLYRLMGLLTQRLPTWQISSGVVDYALKGLIRDGLVRSIVSGGGKTVYVATAHAEPALDDWMAQSATSPPVRDELYARIVSSSPRHADLLVQALDAFEERCFARLNKTPGADSGSGSWRSLTISAVRTAEDEDIHAKVRWAKKTRKAIKDYAERDRQR